jgi:predicted O-methyltransferase YrrM
MISRDDESASERRGFDDALALVAGVEGWLTDAQARRLWDRARAVAPGGRIVEIGSFRGRSTIVLAHAAGDDIDVLAIDPHAGTDRGPQEIVTTPERGESDYERFVANLRRAGVDSRVRHVRRFSQDALGELGEPIDLLYIDGAHRYAPARADIRDPGRRVASGGTLLIHDSFSALGVTAAIATELLAGPHFRYVGRVGSLAEYRRVRLDVAARTRNIARQLSELPYFIRNLLVKVLIVLFRRLTRLLRSDGEWPY